MDPIQGPGPAGLLTPPSGKPRAGAGGFSVGTGAAAGRAAPSAATADVSLAGLLMLQEAGDPDVQDREARKRGRDLLDELSGLQRDLLAGAPGRERLLRLTALIGEIPAANDKRLRAVMAGISLRAHIELARYGAL